jgi:opacity protein-like surface antigen
MVFKNYKALFICLIAFMLSSPAVVFAGAESGFYLGAGIGDASVEADGTAPEGTYSFSESDSGYKIFGGYNFGLVPLIDIAAEISYVDFGNPSGIFPTNNPINFNVSGYDAFGLVGFSFGPFGLFAKAGMIQWDSDSVIGAASTSDSGTDPAYGIGARFQLSSLAIRAEYEVFDLSGGISDLTMLSVSGVFTF